MILHNTITVSKANVQATLRAETSVLAAANPKFGRFDPYQSIAQQIEAGRRFGYVVDGKGDDGRIEPAHGVGNTINEFILRQSGKIADLENGLDDWIRADRDWESVHGTRIPVIEENWNRHRQARG